MVNYLKKLRNEQHRAVAPIIATLIMVAIAVVGGVMVYVFTQGFFSGTQTTGPSTDVIVLTGYDARDIAAPLTAFDGDALANMGGTAGGGLQVNDEVTIHFRNSGQSGVTISNVKVNGAPSSFVSNPTVTLASGQFALYDGAGYATGTPSIPAQSEATVVYSVTEPLSNGRQVSVEINTSSGASFTYQMIIGQRE